MNLSLDAGCGNKGRGTINLDLYIEAVKHRSYRPLMYKQIRNFIIGDINNLPFKNKIFEIAYCEHVLEHEGVNTIQTIKELIRVTKRRVEIRMPHYLLLLAQKIFPIYGHNKTLIPFFYMKILKNITHKRRSFDWSFVHTRWGKLPIFLPGQYEIILYL